MIACGCEEVVVGGEPMIWHVKQNHMRAAVPEQPPSLSEYMRLSREQMARDRAKFTGSAS
jgi:hypothetical protein